MYKFLIIVLFLYINTNFAQTINKIEKEQYNFLVDSLANQKSDLIAEKENLTEDISNLEKRLLELDEEIKTCKTNKIIKKYGQEIGSRIVNGQIWKGMSEKMLEDSWGKPDKITKNKEKWGTFTQWFYGEISYFFKNSELIGWEEKK